MTFQSKLLLTTGIFALGLSAALPIANAVATEAAHPHTNAKVDPIPLRGKSEPKSQKKEKKSKNKKMAEKAADEDDSEDKADEKWDVNNPPGDKREIDINVTEGTWMSLDVSPDGKTIAFDLLGDIYTMPASGGEATNIASGMAWEMQPRFSPDGERIAFTSDRAGGDNIWIMNVDGSDMEQVTDESFRLLNNATWHPNGRFIAARKHFTTSRSLGTGEIWLYSTKGGSGVQLTKKPSEAHQKEIGEPMFSPDGKYVYYSANTTSGPIFEYAQDSNTQLFEIKKYDMETGDISDVAGGAGGAVRPTPSPDGKHIAYVKRVRAQSKLFIKDLKSGEERMVFDHLDQDMQETWAVHGVYPNMDWSPDSKSIYFWASGLIHRYDVADDNIAHIDFGVNDTRTVIDAPRPQVDVAPKKVKMKMPRFTQVSPNGKLAVFETQGKLHLIGMKGGEAIRMTKLPDDVKELYPSWSRDGKHIVFTTWTDADLAQIHMYNVDSDKIKTLDMDPGHYRRPVLSPDGDFIAYEKDSGGNITSDLWGADPGIYVMALDGGEPMKIRDSGGSPHFGKDGLRVYFTASKDKKANLISTNLLGDDERVHASSQLAQSFHMSPTGKNIAVRENYNLYVMPSLPGPQNVAAAPGSKALPIVKLSENGATYPNWSKDGQSLNWSLGPNIYTVNAVKAMDDEDYEAPDPAKTLKMTFKADKPKGDVLLINANIITMSDEDGGVIENGLVWIDGDRISKIGEMPDDVEDIMDLSGNMKVVDLKGKTIMPGLIDAHAHGPQGSDELIPQQNWETVATLALGVTTIFDPSSRASEIFAANELQQTGKLLAPRTFSTGEVIYGAKAPGFYASIKDYDDAYEHVARLKTQGAHGIKNYNQPRRDQRQQVATAARELDILNVAEGGSLFHMDLSMVADGNSSIEHNLPQSKLYDDVIQFYSQTNVAYTPTLVVTYGGVRGEDYYYQESDVWKHPILSKHANPDILRSRAVRRQMAPESDYSDAVSAATSKQLMDAGVLVNIGAHGQREGLAAHWEMWSFARGGMSNLEALQTATVNPAKHLGFWDDLGSLEEGKLADLVILDANPLDDIRNTDDISYIMIGGRMYDAKSMDEVKTGDAKRRPYYWE